jgi:hypothetical protein
MTPEWRIIAKPLTELATVLEVELLASSRELIYRVEASAT